MRLPEDNRRRRRRRRKGEFTILFVRFHLNPFKCLIILQSIAFIRLRVAKLINVVEPNRTALPSSATALPSPAAPAAAGGGSPAPTGGQPAAAAAAEKG